MDNMYYTINRIIKRLTDSDLQCVNISETTSLINDLGFDSISIVGLILEIENTFNIELDNYDFDTICNYGKLCKTIELALNERKRV